MNKSFSVVIPLYNAEKYIEKTLFSIINTAYDKALIQVIVVDDGSSDNSANIVKEIAKKYPFIEYHLKPNGQWGSTINYAKNNQLIKHDYVSVLDADDLYSEQCFNILNNLANSSPDVIVGTYRKFDGKKIRKKVLPYWFIFKRKLNNLNQKNTPYCLPLVFFSKKEIFMQMKDLTEKMAYQDPDYSTQLMHLSNQIIFTKKVTGYYFYNRENNSISQAWNEKRFQQELNACLKCIENDGQELVSYRLNLKAFVEIIKAKNIKFEVNRKFKFAWYPWYIRWIYALMHFIKFRKYFIINKK